MFLVGETDEKVVAHGANRKQIVNLISAIENGDIDNVCRGFQPIEIIVRTIPAACAAGYNLSSVSPTKTLKPGRYRSLY